MPKYRVLTPKGASFTVAGGGYDLEREALDPIGAEIIEAPANETEFIAAAKNADAIYAKGMQGRDRQRRRTPAPRQRVVGRVMQRVRIHRQLRPSRPTRATLR